MITLRTQRNKPGKDTIKRHMISLVKIDQIGYDPKTGEINSTLLAEYAADDFGHNEWLDDDLHIIWDAAVEVAEAIEAQNA